MGTTAQPVVRVGIVEDERVTRELLQKLLDGSGNCRVGAAFGCMEEALSEIGTHLPDVVLVDIGLPGMSGIEGIRILRGRYPHIPLMVLSVYRDDERIFEAVCAGACGYLLKTMPLARLAESIQDVVHGGAPMSPEVARRVVELFRRMRPPERASHDLTAHEIRLLKLLAEGHTYKTAAVQLGVTAHTVSFHLRQIYDKLQVHSKSEAVSKALRRGLVS
jgi:DNA-binding NarL/FixJ family response regulator